MAFNPPSSRPNKYSHKQSSVYAETAKKSVENLFADREAPRNAFWKAWNDLCITSECSCETLDYKVINYFGIGGLGKSFLQAKLRQELDDQAAKNNRRIFYVSHDFVSEQLEMTDVLKALRNELVRKAEFEFSVFDFALYYYFNLCDIDVLKPKKEILIENSKVFSIFSKAIQIVPVASDVFNILDVIKDLICNGINLKIEQQEEIKRLRFYDKTNVEELKAELPYYFALDFNECVKNMSEPVVVFLDSYEYLVNELKQLNPESGPDLWLKSLKEENPGLCMRLSKCLWVISGREKLNWQNLEPNFAGISWNENYMELHELDYFTDKDAFEYLNNSCKGIDTELCQQLITKANGLPIYLSVCQEYWHLLVEKGKTPRLTNFGETINELIDCYINYLGDSTGNLLELLVCLGQWTNALYLDLPTELCGGIGDRDLDRIYRMSFIKRTADEYFKIHDIVQEVLFEKCSLIKKQKICQRYKLIIQNAEEECSIPAYIPVQYVKLALSIFTKEPNEQMKNSIFKDLIETITPLLQGMIDSMNLASTKVILNLLLESINGQVDNWEKVDIIKLYYKYISKDYGIKAFEQTELLQHSLNLYRDTLMLSADYNQQCLLLTVDILYAYIMYLANNLKDAFLLSKQNVVTSAMLLGRDDLTTLKALSGLTNCYQRRNSNNDRLKAMKLRLRIYDLRLEILGESAPDTLTSLDKLGNSYGMLGDYKKAAALREKLYSICLETFGETHPKTLHACSNFAISLQRLGNYTEALEKNKYIYEKRKAFMGSDHVLTLKSGNQLASCLSALGYYNDALKIRQDNYPRYIALLGENHVSTLDSLHDLAFSYSKANNKEMAFILRQEVYDKRMILYNNGLGMDPLNAKGNLALSYIDKGDLSKALLLQQEVYKKRRDSLGENSPKTLVALTNLADTEFALKHFNCALEMRQRVYDNRVVQLNPDNPVTLKSLFNLAESFTQKCDYAISIEMLEEVCAKSKEKLPPNHPDTILAGSELDRVKKLHTNN